MDGGNTKKETKDRGEKRGRVNTKKVRRELLAAYIWREESFRMEMEKEEKGKRTKKTETKETEIEEEDEEGPA